MSEDNTDIKEGSNFEMFDDAAFHISAKTLRGVNIKGAVHAFLDEKNKEVVYLILHRDEAGRPIVSKIDISTARYDGAFLQEIESLKRDKERLEKIVGGIDIDDPSAIDVMVDSMKAQGEEMKGLRKVVQEARKSCACGARGESLDTHPHVGGCELGKAFEDYDKNRGAV